MQQPITLHDLDAVVKVIDTVSARGAFRGDELSSVGVLRDKIVSVLVAAQEEIDKNKPEVEEVTEVEDLGDPVPE